MESKSNLLDRDLGSNPSESIPASIRVNEKETHPKPSGSCGNRSGDREVDLDHAARKRGSTSGITGWELVVWIRPVRCHLILARQIGGAIEVQPAIGKGVW